MFVLQEFDDIFMISGIVLNNLSEISLVSPIFRRSFCFFLK